MPKEGGYRHAPRGAPPRGTWGYPSPGYPKRAGTATLRVALPHAERGGTQVWGTRAETETAMSPVSGGAPAGRSLCIIRAGGARQWVAIEAAGLVVGELVVEFLERLVGDLADALA